MKRKLKLSGEWKGETCIEKQLAILLLREIVFLSDFWWKAKWPINARNMAAINVLCNDCFAGGADAELVTYEDIPNLFSYYEKDPNWGSYVWCIKRRNMLPQKSIYDDIMKGGIWNLDEMELYENPTWKKDIDNNS